MRRYIKKALIIFPVFCFGCSNNIRTLNRNEAIQYANEHFVSKAELTPKTLITFRTINYSNEQAKAPIISLTFYGYSIDLDASLNGQKSLLTKEEFIQFYRDPFLPLNEETIASFPSDTTFQLKGDEMEIKSIENSEGSREEKLYNYLTNGYEKTRIETFERDNKNYSFKVVVTSVYNYQ